MLTTMTQQGIKVAIICILIAASEQRPSVPQDEKPILLQNGLVTTSIVAEDTETTISSVEETTSLYFSSDLLRGGRIIRNTDSEDTTLTSTENAESTTATTKTTESSSKISSFTEDITVNYEDGVSETPRESTDFLGIFLQAVMRSPDEIIAKRSAEVPYGDEEKNEADLDTAANTVFRPLFVYRQQNAQRRRLRTLNVF